MNIWDPTELRAFGDPDELDIAPRRPDDTLRPYTTIWAVRVEDDLYVRSFHGPDGGWYRRALSARTARIRVDDHELDVDVHPPHKVEDIDDAISDAYRAKYACYGDRYLDPMTGPTAIEATLRLTPAA